MKNQFNVKKIVRYTLIVVVCSLVVSAGAAWATGTSLFNLGISSNSEKMNIDDTKEHDISKVDSINIDTVSSDIRVILTSEEDVKTHFYGYSSTKNKKVMPYLVTELNGNTLNIDIEHPAKIKFFYNSDLKLDVYVPEKYANDMKIHVTSGNVDIEKLKVNDFDCITTSGNINIQSLQTKKSNFKSTSGHVNIQSLQSEKSNFHATSGKIIIDNFTGELVGKSTSGDISVSYEKLNKDLEIKNTSGEVKLKFPENSNFEVDFETASGDFSSEFPMTILGDRNDEDVKGTVGKGGNKIKVKTTSGDLEISN